LKKIFFAKGCELFSFEKFDFFNFSENFWIFKSLKKYYVKNKISPPCKIYLSANFPPIILH
jgi:hypothetical protein